MGFNPRYNRWTVRNWAGYAPTVGDLIDKRCFVEARCTTCHGAFKVRLKVIAALMGRRYSLWGARGPCPVLACQGRVAFIFHAPRGDGGPYWMISRTTMIEASEQSAGDDGQPRLET